MLDAEAETEPLPEERSVHWRELAGGMVKLELVLQSDEADLVLRAFERARELPAPRIQQGEPADPVQPAEEVEQAGEPDAVSAEAPAVAERPVSEEAPWPSRADGVVRLAESYLAAHPATGTGGERSQVMVHLGQEALAADGQWTATLEDGTRVSAEALRRVACDCAFVAVSEGGDGQTLNIGRRTRSGSRWTTLSPGCTKGRMSRASS